MKKQVKIKIKDSQRRITINKKLVTHLAKQVLKIKNIDEAELSILFVGRSRIHSLNKKFRKIDRPTNVLAFSMREGKNAHLHPEILGDVVICPGIGKYKYDTTSKIALGHSRRQFSREMAQRFARIYKTTKEQEIYLYLIHGILHLLGYDDSSAKSRSFMEKEQARILKKIIKDKQNLYHRAHRG